MCNPSCKNEECYGPGENECLGVALEAFDSLIVKILAFKSALWVLTSVIGTILDYKSAKLFGKSGSVKIGDPNLQIHVSDKQVDDLMKKEYKKERGKIGGSTFIIENVSHNRRKRNTFIRTSMVKVQSTLSDLKKQSSDNLSSDLDSPMKRSQNNLNNISQMNLQS